VKLYAVQRQQWGDQQRWANGQSRLYVAAVTFALPTVATPDWTPSEVEPYPLGVDVQYVTRGDLEATEEGREALRAWDSDDEAVIVEESEDQYDAILRQTLGEMVEWGKDFAGEAAKLRLALPSEGRLSEEQRAEARRVRDLWGKAPAV
jgi:hypothetical protein